MGVFSSVGGPDDLGDEWGMLFDRHVFNEAVVVDEEGAALGVLSDFFVLGLDALFLAGKSCSLKFRVEAVLGRHRTLHGAKGQFSYSRIK